MTIYKITNLLNGKIYVGQRKQKMQAELNEREKFWIKILNSKRPNGYNQTNGGGGFQKITKNISKNLPQKIFTIEDRKNIVEDSLLKIF